MVQLSHPYMTPGKTIALTRQTFVGKVMFLLFKGLIIAYFLPVFEISVHNLILLAGRRDKKYIYTWQSLL